MRFTEEQQAVIDARHQNILVSAAAGSGKTAVLTERILGLISGEDAVDIDRLLVVTFTRAAAAQMKEKISARISRALQENPQDEHLQRQQTLIHHAQITTIDSFCQSVIRSHFGEIDLDPSYRVVEEGEITLLEQQVLSELLEKEYALSNRKESDPSTSDFLFCADYFSEGASDEALEKNILDLYHKSVSTPFPDLWLKERMDDYEVPEEDFDALFFVKEVERKTMEQLQDAVHTLQRAAMICDEADGPMAYTPNLQAEIAQIARAISQMEEGEGYEKVRSALFTISFGNLKPVRDKSVSPSKKKAVSEMRKEVKDRITHLKERYFARDQETEIGYMRLASRAVRELARLSLVFLEEMEKAKRERNIIDFSDMEHEALRILIHREETEDGQILISPTEAAQALRQEFKEVMIDEYQDSNEVQELILKAVSTQDDGVFNRFMVGDVKQSIYRFRQARPEIFMEKMDRYQKEEKAKERRMDLHRNFRSRSEVLLFVNDCFQRLMKKDLGGVEYDADARLVPGLAYKEAEAGSYDPEILLLVSAEAGGEKSALEARMIAGRIKELLRSCRVDNGAGGLRPLRYQDIVLLMRSAGAEGRDEIFRKTLEQEGIPAYVESRTGYFSAQEVQVLLALLSVIDNPLQDIPFASVMRSQIGGFSDEELAKVRAEGKKKGWIDDYFAQSVARYAAEDEKTAKFLDLMEDFRKHSSYLQTHELLHYILEKTQFDSYIRALPAGERRLANVKMLLTKARAFEKTSFRGSSHFVRYIEQLKKYEVDFGEANVLDESADVVRIMTIHKSKGLEFPVVFVCGTHHKVNLQDANGRMILDSDLGAGLDYIQTEERIRDSTMKKALIADHMKEVALGEELRVLYVAMTRAKEKLILTGLVKEEEKVRELLELHAQEEGALLYSDRVSGESYLKLVLLAYAPYFAGGQPFAPAKLTFCSEEDLATASVKEQVNLALLQKKLLTQGVDTIIQPSKEEEKGLVSLLLPRFQEHYAHEKALGLFAKTTVTELKQSLIDEATASLEAHPFAYAEGKKEREGRRSGGGGAQRGTLYHRAMELLPLALLQAGAQAKAQEVEAFLQKEKERGRFDEEGIHQIRIEDLQRFLRSAFATRMARAMEQKRLFRERQFMIGLPANRMNPDFPGEELVLVQGVIDCYFEEEGELVLIDYKTDCLDEEKLRLFYKPQLEIYKEALEQLTNQKVKEMALYSFHLGKEIAFS